MKAANWKAPNSIRRVLVVVAIATGIFIGGAWPLLKPLSSALGAATILAVQDTLAKLHVQRPTRLYLLAGFHFRQGQTAKTISLCEEILDKYPDQFEPSQKRMIYTMLGLSYGNVGKTESEFQVYERLMPSDPAYAHFLKGIALFDEGKRAASRQELQLALQSETASNPLDADTKHALALTLEHANAVAQ